MEHRGFALPQAGRRWWHVGCDCVAELCFSSLRRLVEGCPSGEPCPLAPRRTMACPTDRANLLADSAPKWFLLLAAWPVLLVGCGPAGTERIARSADATTTSAETTASEFLREVFRRYRNAASYGDRGEVRLTVEVSGRREERAAPLSVWFASGELYVEAYDLRMRSTPDGLACWVLDEANGNLDSQVLIAAPLEGRPQIAQLLSDPLVAARLSAGLAGPPPQLEWLLAEDPMRGLFEAGLSISFAEDGPIDGHRCRRVQAEGQGERYVFWVDANRGVIRRVDLPPPLPGRDGVSGTISRLRLELAGASFVPGGPPSMTPLPTRPRYVRNLVPPPPPEPPKILGRRPPSFSIADVSGHHRVTEQGGDREVTVLVRIGDGQRSLEALAAARHWAAMLPAELRRRAGVMLVVDETAPQSLGAELRRSSDEELPVLDDREGRLAEAIPLPSGGAAMLDSRGALVWLQPSLTAASLPTLGTVLADVLAGVDVPGRLRQQWRTEREAYRQALLREQAKIGDKGRSTTVNVETP